MNILEKRKINSQITDIVKKLIFKNHKIKLAGSASLASQKYFSDYDFICKVMRKYKQKTIYDEFKRILEYSDERLYFMEFKVQYMDDTKIKIYDKKIKRAMFKNLDYVKIDYILWFEYQFKEVSVIYSFYNVKKTIFDIKKDYDELVREGSYYKALKRLFSMKKLEMASGKTEVLRLTTFFNSDMGKLYELNSNLKTIQLLKTMHYDRPTQKRIEINLKYLKIDPTSNLEEMIKHNDIKLNNAAEKYLI